MTVTEAREAGSQATTAALDAGAALAIKAQNAATTALGVARATADEVAGQFPAIASAGVDASAESVRALQELGDPSLKLLTAFSLGLGAGLWLAGAPRLVTLLAFSPALLAAIAIASRSTEAPHRRR
jgi:hypothetical protein